MSNKKKLTYIQKLKAAYGDNFSIQLEATSSGTNNTSAAKAIVQILKPQEDKAPLVVRFSTAYGVGKDFEEAQNSATVNAVEGLGL